MHTSQQLSDTNDSYSWDDSAWINPSFDSYQIVELNFRSLTPKDAIAATSKQIRQLKKAGINAVLIRPNARITDRVNASIQEILEVPLDIAARLKHVVNTCHYEGIAVIIDIDIESFRRTLIDQTEAQLTALRPVWTENALKWFKDFHADALRFHNLHEIPQHDTLLKQLREAASLMSKRTGRQYYLLVECDTMRRRRSVLGHYVQHFLCRAQQSRFVRAGVKATRTGLARMIRPFHSKPYRQDYMYDKQFAKVLRDFFRRTA